MTLSLPSLASLTVFAVATSTQMPSKPDVITTDGQGVRAHGINFPVLLPSQ